MSGRTPLVIQLAVMSLALALAGCFRPALGPADPAAAGANASFESDIRRNTGAAVPAFPAIFGRVRWESAGLRPAQALLGEIARGATVSLQELDTGIAVASTVTAVDGAFSLDLAGWAPVAGRPYALEAVKGLTAGGTPNRVGGAAARLRSIVSLDGGRWTSLTGPSIQISRSTTAIAIVGGVDGLDVNRWRALLGSLGSGTSAEFSATADVTRDEYSQVLSLIDAALALDQDPVRAIARPQAGGAFVRLERGPVVTDVSSWTGKAGDVVTIHGSGFDPTASNNVVTFGGVPATVVAVEGGGTRLRATVPVGARGGPIAVAIGALVTVATGTYQAAAARISTLAGSTSPLPGTRATDWLLPETRGVAVDAQGRTFFTAGHQVFRVDSDGMIALVAGTGSQGFSGDGGAATAAQLNAPWGLAVDRSGNVFIADMYNNRIRMVSAAGTISTAAGNGSNGSAGDGGPATQARLAGPRGVAVDGSGNLFIADSDNSLIRKVTPDGLISTVAGGGSQPGGDGGPATEADLDSPVGVALDGSGNLFIASIWYIRKVSSTGTITTVAGNGSWGGGGDGGLATAASVEAVGVAADGSGTFYLTDGQRVRKVNSAGIISTVAGGGSFSDDPDYAGTATQAVLQETTGVAADGAGNLFIADSQTHRIRKVSAAGAINTVAGTGAFYSDSGPPTAQQLNAPCGLALDGSGNLFIADFGNHAILEISSAGAFSLVAGRGYPGWEGEPGSPARTAALNTPKAVAVDGAGTLYIADQENHLIRKVSPGGTITDLSGGRGGGFSGDAGLALDAELNAPRGLAVDGAGNVFIADSANHRIRKVFLDTDCPSCGYWIISTIAGDGVAGYSGDGGAATGAQLKSPFGLAVDGAGNLFVADSGNHRIRRVTPAGVITTVAGKGTAGYSGDGGAAVEAKLSFPSGVAVGTAGDLFIADTGNHRIRKVTAAGTITSFVGNGIRGFSGDGGDPESAQLDSPCGLALDKAGNLLIADTGNHRIRKVTP